MNTIVTIIITAIAASLGGVFINNILTKKSQEKKLKDLAKKIRR